LKINRIVLNSARIIGLTAGFLWTFILLSGSITSNGVYNRQLTFLFLLIVANFASVILALWSEKLGGILLTTFSLTLCAFAIVIAGRNKIIAASVSGIPFLVSGILFIIYSKIKPER